MTARFISLKALQVKQPIGNFLIGMMSAADLVSISFADVRELKRELDTYIGIQRRLDPKRVKAISKYVRTMDATFPTSVLLAVEGQCVVWDEQTSLLRLQETADIPFEKIAKILDGQHRVAGLADAEMREGFEIAVSIFVDADIADQANIFATVNLAQTKVNKSLVYDLFDYQNARSPQKTSHYVALALDKAEHSPFRARIKRLGFKERPTESLTQATVVEELIRLISSQPQDDQDLLLRGRKLPKVTSKELEKTPLRKMFVDEMDDEIAQVLFNFFSAVEKKWPQAWRGENRGEILSKTNGFKSLMWFLGRLLPSLSSEGTEVPTVSRFSRSLDAVPLKDSDFNTENFQPGSSGQSALKGYFQKALG